MMKKFQFSLLSLYLVFFASSAVAALESVPPVSGGYWYETSIPAWGHTPDLASFCVAYFNYSVPLSTYPNRAFTGSALSTSTAANCIWSRDTGWMPLNSIGASVTYALPVCPVPTSGASYVFNAVNGLCERTIPCPNSVNDGLHFVPGSLVGTLQPSGTAYCDSSTQCEVSNTTIVSVLGVGVIRSTGLPTSCAPSSPPSPSITVQITPAEAAKVQDVAAKAPFVDPVVTAAARDAAASSQAASAAATARLDAAVAAHQAAVTAQTAAKDAVRAAGDTVVASPTAANVTNYNNAMTVYNTASTTTNSTSQAVNTSYQIAQTASASAADAATKLASVTQSATDLANAIAASTAAFNQSQVSAKLAGTAGLDAVLAAQQAVIAGLSQKVAAATATSNSTTSTVNNNNTTVNNYSTTVNNSIAGVAGLPPVTSPASQPPAVSAASSVASVAPPAAGTVAEFCAANPDNAGCATLGEGSIPTETISAKTVDISASMNHFMFSGAAFCPADKIFMTHGQRIVISYAPFCTFLGIFRFMALAVAAFVSGMIILGQRSSDSGG